MLCLKIFHRTEMCRWINAYLQDWCYSQAISFLDHGTLFEKSGLLGVDLFHLSEKRKSIFRYSLVKLVKRALN